MLAAAIALPASCAILLCSRFNLWLLRATPPATPAMPTAPRSHPTALRSAHHCTPHRSAQVCVTIVGTYFLLNAENYHWHWTAFSAGASTCELRAPCWPACPHAAVPAGLSAASYSTEHPSLFVALPTRKPHLPGAAPGALLCGLQAGSLVVARITPPVGCSHHATLAASSSQIAAIYVMLYSVHYFVVKTKMTGFFQTAFYFGYTAMFCLGASARWACCGGQGGAGAGGCWVVVPRSGSPLGTAWHRMHQPLGHTCVVLPARSARPALGVARPAAEFTPRTPARRPPRRCAGLSIMCGALGYLGALAFVRRIFRNVKVGTWMHRVCRVPSLPAPLSGCASASASARLHPRSSAACSHPKPRPVSPPLPCVQVD